MLVRGKTMVGRYVVTRLDDGGETILADAAEADEVFEVVVDDVLTSNALADNAAQDRKQAIEMAAIMKGLQNPPFPKEATVFQHQYRIEELPDDPAVLDEFYRSRFRRPNFMHLVCRLPGKLRYEIWPNESQHRGRPHCKVSYNGESATLSIPDGELLAGSLRRHEAEARRTIQTSGNDLLQRWEQMRPDDQRL